MMRIWWEWFARNVIKKDSFGWPMLVSSSATLAAFYSGIATTPQAVGIVWLLTMAASQAALNIANRSRILRRVLVDIYRRLGVITLADQRAIAKAIRDEVKNRFTKSDTESIEVQPTTKKIPGKTAKVSQPASPHKTIGDKSSKKAKKSEDKSTTPTSETHSGSNNDDEKDLKNKPYQSTHDTREYDVGMKSTIEKSSPESDQPKNREFE